MAALNTLRTKGSILLTAVIGISLLAFLLGDGTSLFNSTNTTVGTINGEDVSLKEYATEVDLMTNIRQFMTNTTSLNSQETEMIQNQVWNKFVTDAVLLPSFKNLGLEVSDAELLDMVNGANISPVVMQIFTDPASGAFDKERLTQFVSNLGADATGRARNFWSFVESQSADNRMNEKFNTLIKEGMYVTSLQVEQSLADNSSVYSIDFVAKALSTIADDAVKVTDADLKEYYNKHIARFKSVDATQVEYVTFDIIPSQEDLSDAEVNANKIAGELAESSELEQYVNYTSEQKFDPRYFKQADLPQYLQEQVVTAEIGASFAPNFEDNVYLISRLAGARVMPDSITFQGVVVAATENVDSIINVIKATDGGFDSVVATLSLSGTQGTQPMAVNTTMLTEELGEKLLAAKKGDVVAIDNQGAKNLFKIISVGAPVKKYQIAQVVISVVPSERTEQIIYERANDFRNVISGGKSFEEAVAANQYIKRTATVEPTNREFAQMTNSRELVRWSLLDSNKEGALSTVVKMDEVNVVAFIKRKTIKGVASFEDMKAEIRPLYIEKAKMDMAVKELSGVTSLETLATTLNTQVGTASDIAFSASMIPGLGIAPEVVGALLSMKMGSIVAIPAGQSAAAVKITSKISNEGMSAEKIRVMLETLNTSYLDSRIGGSVYKMIDIKDNRVIYY